MFYVHVCMCVKSEREKKSMCGYVLVAFVHPWHDKQALVDRLSSLALDAGSDQGSYL